MSTPPDSPAPAPKSPLGAPSPLGSAHSLEGAPKPAFKVTRSPFAPRISGQGSASQSEGSVFTGASSATPPKPSFARKSGSSSSGGDTSPALLAVDFICAAVAIAAAVMMWLHTR